MTPIRRLALVGALAAALLGSVGPVTATSAQARTDSAAIPRATANQAKPPNGAQLSTLYQKHVKSTTSSVRVFTTWNGSEIWGTWGPCTNFYTDRTDGSRYHTWVSVSGQTRDAWVTSDTQYVASGWC